MEAADAAVAAEPEIRPEHSDAVDAVNATAAVATATAAAATAALQRPLYDGSWNCRIRRFRRFQRFRRHSVK